MKTLGKVFFAIGCITLLFACSKPYTVSWTEVECESKNIKFSSEKTVGQVQWDAPTKLVNGKTITSDQDLRYNVLIESVDGKLLCSNLKKSPKSIDGKTQYFLRNPANPIYDINFTLTGTITQSCDPGRYLIGIQAITTKANKDHKSTIAWSNCAKKPFGIKVSE